ncbi:NfeD family protein [Paenibacillus sp. y28]|uniref:NfeD family protein n=1 Tax=Paenibacillus sp. y28 TaxID=3129110 RepID=UPI003015B124
MRSKIKPFVCLLALLAVLACFIPFAQGGAAAAEGVKKNDSTNGEGAQIVFIVPLKSTIETGLERFLHRAFAEAEKARAGQIILEMNTLGGRIDSALGIGDLIKSSPVPVTVFIRGEAISAGSYIALNASRIVMEPGSTIGAASVVDIAGNEIEKAKTVSVWSGNMQSAAEMHGRNKKIAEKMVDKTMELTLPEIGKTYAQGQLLTLTAEEALKVGYAEQVLSTRGQVLEYIGKGHETQVIEFNPSVAERLARVMTDPWVSTILLLIGIVGIALELFIPGFGLPGMIGIAGFGLYFFGHYIAGFAGVEHMVLFIAGIVLLIAEIFVPSFGILGLLGGAALVSGIVLAAYDTSDAMLNLGIAALFAIIIVGVCLKVFKRRGIWNKLVLKEKLTSEEGFVSQSSRDHLFGQHGLTITPLRPSGTAVIGRERVDVVTDGEFIPAGTRVGVVRLEGIRVVVRSAEQDGDEEGALQGLRDEGPEHKS